MPIQEAARLMKDEDVGVLPVVESEGSKRLLGLVTDRDIAIRVVAEGRDARESRVQDAMSSNPKTARPDDDLDSVMELMGRERFPKIGDLPSAVEHLALAAAMRPDITHYATALRGARAALAASR